MKKNKKSVKVKYATKKQLDAFIELMRKPHIVEIFKRLADK